jgi:transcriptional regulator with XRE-family HTH domain
MSPFSKFLRDLRTSRGLKQSEFAMLLGYEQSYLSSLERGIKGLPRRAFVNRLIRELELNCEEIAELERTFSVSERRFTLATNASPEEYQLWAKLKSLSGRLDPARVQLIIAVLELPRASPRHDEYVSRQCLCVERGASM